MDQPLQRAIARLVDLGYELEEYTGDGRAVLRRQFQTLRLRQRDDDVLITGDLPEASPALTPFPVEREATGRMNGAPAPASLRHLPKVDRLSARAHRARMQRRPAQSAGLLPASSPERSTALVPVPPPAPALVEQVPAAGPISAVDEPRSEVRRRWVTWLMLLLAIAIAIVAVAVQAGAELPPLPSLPDLPDLPNLPDLPWLAGGPAAPLSPADR